MKRLTSIVLAVVFAAASVAGDAAAQGTLSDRTIVTFNTPVEVPGRVLPPGTYVFKLGDPESQHVVQVFDEKEEKVLGQWLVVEAKRPEEDASIDTVMAFVETEGGVPAIQYWWYPGELVGKEFVYPEEQAREISQRSGRQVRTGGDDDEDRPVATSGSRDEESDDEPAGQQER